MYIRTKDHLLFLNSYYDRVISKLRKSKYGQHFFSILDDVLKSKRSNNLLNPNTFKANWQEVYNNIQSISNKYKIPSIAYCYMTTKALILIEDFKKHVKSSKILYKDLIYYFVNEYKNGHKDSCTTGIGEGKKPLILNQNSPRKTNKTLLQEINQIVTQSEEKKLGHYTNIFIGKAKLKEILKLSEIKIRNGKHNVKVFHMKSKDPSPRSPKIITKDCVDVINPYDQKQIEKGLKDVFERKMILRHTIRMATQQGTDLVKSKSKLNLPTLHGNSCKKEVPFLLPDSYRSTTDYDSYGKTTRNDPNKTFLEFKMKKSPSFLCVKGGKLLDVKYASALYTKINSKGFNNPNDFTLNRNDFYFK